MNNTMDDLGLIDDIYKMGLRIGLVRNRPSRVDTHQPERYYSGVIFIVRAQDVLPVLTIALVGRYFQDHVCARNVTVPA